MKKQTLTHKILICLLGLTLFGCPTGAAELSGGDLLSSGDDSPAVFFGSSSEQRLIEEIEGQHAKLLKEQEQQQEQQRLLEERLAREEEEAKAEAEAKERAENERRREEERLAKRQEIVDFALQFVGNPYVYGGTSLTGGADCSGFVMAVFDHFGITLPRVAADQYRASTQKSLNDLEVGDLVFYGGDIHHVALYAGGGKVVHACNSSTGIIVSDYDYETPSFAGTYLE